MISKPSQFHQKFNSSEIREWDWWLIFRGNEQRTKKYCEKWEKNTPETKLTICMNGVDGCKRLKRGLPPNQTNDFPTATFFTLSLSLCRFKSSPKPVCKFINLKWACKYGAFVFSPLNLVESVDVPTQHFENMQKKGLQVNLVEFVRKLILSAPSHSLFDSLVNFYGPWKQLFAPGQRFKHRIFEFIRR